LSLLKKAPPKNTSRRGFLQGRAFGTRFPPKRRESSNKNASIPYAKKNDSIFWN
jgi:hypothetical protein